MGKVLDFKPKNAKRKPRESTLCRNNHHKWEVQKSNRFDVKLGKLVTVERCSRCGTTRNKLT